LGSGFRVGSGFEISKKIIVKWWVRVIKYLK
jgi:hypothetical protein